jgi:hypothetical protein
LLRIHCDDLKRIFIVSVNTVVSKMLLKELPAKKQSMITLAAISDLYFKADPHCVRVGCVLHVPCVQA